MSAPPSAPRLHLGTSGFSYPAWKGTFYPPDLKPAAMLRYYAERFSAVEINATFYRMPTEATLEAWLLQVPPEFIFVLKAPQRITHQLRLVGAEPIVQHFTEIAQSLGERLGLLLFQLPPNFKKDLAKLGAFLELLPRGQRVSFEFRNPSWFDGETLQLLRSRGVALCWEEAEEIESPFESTADIGYLRLRMPEYSDQALQGWADRIRAQGWKEVFVFFKHEDEGKGPMFARRFKEMWERG
jgi:uncharacterized protein YecE (DUF72 family)